MKDVIFRTVKNKYLIQNKQLLDAYKSQRIDDLLLRGCVCCIILYLYNLFLNSEV